MGSFHPAHKSAGAPAHHPVNHHVYPTRVDDGSQSEIDPATRSDPGELEKEAEEDRKAEATRAAQDAHKTVYHAPSLERPLPIEIYGRETTDTATACGGPTGDAQHGSQRPCS